MNASGAILRTRHRKRAITAFLLVIICGLLSMSTFAEASGKTTAPNRLAALDSIVRQAIQNGEIPGAVVLIGHDGQVIYRKAFGHRSLEPRREPMTTDTIFDIASLTKVVATTTAVMQLEERGTVRLNDPAMKYIPEFAQNGKDDITLRELLTHFSGLPEGLDLKQPWQGRAAGLREAYEIKPIAAAGARFHYSDVNFIVLGSMVERLTDTSLDKYCAARIFAPLGMAHTRFLPPAAWLPKIAPTQYDEHEHMLRGVVHDPTARRMGGVAGSAGLFSTADDLSKFAQALLNGSPVLSPLAVEKMTTPQQPPTAQVLHGLGWDIDSPYSSPRGDFLPVGSFGHTGFTGTSLWIDPTTKTYIIILTNAVHPRGKGSTIALRSEIATAVATALPLTISEKEKLRWESITGYNETQTAARKISVRNGSVQTGIDVLEAHNFDVLGGSTDRKKKIGILTNQTGVDAQGRRTIDVLAAAPGVSLQAIFSPEHGVTGTLDTTAIGNSRDTTTGVPVYSVYGGTDAARRPSPDVLKTLDAVVIDVQDAGARFYTYETTLGYFLEAAAKAGIEIIVLDRPNPITGSFVQGPISDPGRESFANYSQVPVRHGMTMGELAKMYNEERGIHARLTVVPMAGWLRGDWFDSTDLAWVNPSPNLRSLTEATLYPGVALVEGTNISVGRGTDTPFEVMGAPWANGRELAAYLNARGISGVRFVAASFMPSSGTYHGENCQGINLMVVERNALDGPELGIELASALHKLYPQQYHMDRMMEILANQSVFDAIMQGEDPRRIAEDWQEPLEKFEELRQKYLIYK